MIQASRSLISEEENDLWTEEDGVKARDLCHLVGVEQRQKRALERCGGMSQALGPGANQSEGSSWWSLGCEGGLSGQGDHGKEVPRVCLPSALAPGLWDTVPLRQSLRPWGVQSGGGGGECQTVGSSHPSRWRAALSTPDSLAVCRLVRGPGGGGGPGSVSVSRCVWPLCRVLPQSTQGSQRPSPMSSFTNLLVEANITIVGHPTELGAMLANSQAENPLPASS